ncbi:hypothetical protein Tco_0717337 [Tanacetum coccineum]
MDDPNITMKEYIRLEEEKAHRHDKVYNWETVTYGRIWDDDEVHNLRSVETKFLAIVFNDMFTSQAALSCEPTVNPLNDNEIDFRISFDESDNEDYTVIFDKKIISVDDLKMDSENDNDKVNMPLFPSPEPTGKLVSKNGYDVLEAIRHMALPPRDQRHQYLRFEGLEYTDANITDFEDRFDYDSQIRDKYFVEYTGIKVQHFIDTLLQHLGNVKKSVAERIRHQRQYEIRLNKGHMQTQESKIDTGKAVENGLVVMERNGTESKVQDNSKAVSGMRYRC